MYKLAQFKTDQSNAVRVLSLRFCRNSIVTIASCNPVGFVALPGVNISHLLRPVPFVVKYFDQE